MKKVFKYFLLLLSLIVVFQISSCSANEVGLKLLTFIKQLRGEKVNFTDFDNNNADVPSHQIWNTLLKQHVSTSGNVNYKGFIEDSLQLNQYLQLLSNRPPNENWNSNEQLAYWINVYNAFTVQLIVQHYPVQSIKNIAGDIPMINSPWDIKFFTIGGNEFDLNTVEHEILRKKFNEPRIHFAINCASVSCPKLLNEAYLAEKLEQQLNDQAMDFVNDLEKNNFSEIPVKVSKIFSWFEKDFTKKTTLIAYLNQFLDKKIAEDIEVQYMDYNWNLNE